MNGTGQGPAVGGSVRRATALGLLAAGCLCFLVFHLLPAYSISGGGFGEDWSSEPGWVIWEELFGVMTGLPERLRTPDVETWLELLTCSGFVGGGLLSVAAPFLIGAWCRAPLARWMAVALAAATLVAGPFSVAWNHLTDPPDPDWYRWEVGIYAWMASGVLTFAGLALVPRTRRV